MTNTPRTRLWLAASIGLNLLLVGGFIGNKLDAKSSRADRPNFERFLDTADSDARRTARTQLREAWRTTEASRNKLSDARNHVHAAIKAAPYDEAAVAAAFAAMRDAETQLQAAAHAHLATMLSETQPEQRAALAELMLRNGRPPERNRPRNRPRRQD